jgi:hypothetical protein
MQLYESFGGDFRYRSKEEEAGLGQKRNQTSNAISVNAELLLLVRTAPSTVCRRLSLAGARKLEPMLSCFDNYQNIKMSFLLCLRKAASAVRCSGSGLQWWRHAFAMVQWHQLRSPQLYVFPEHGDGLRPCCTGNLCQRGEGAQICSQLSCFGEQIVFLSIGLLIRAISAQEMLLLSAISSREGEKNTAENLCYSKR